MNGISHTIRFAAAGLLLALVACGGGGDGDGGAGTGTSSASAVIGAAGGTVTGPNGAKIVIPPGALATETTIGIEESSAGAPELPPGLTVRGPMYAFTPHGTTFAVPVTLTLPFDGSAIPSGSGPAFYKTNAQNEWERVTTATFGVGTVTAQITSFSNGQSGIELIECPSRKWIFQTTTNVPSWGTPIEPSRFASKQCGKVLEEFLFGAIDSVFELDHGLTRNLAVGEVFSNAEGLDFSVYSEAPAGDPTLAGFRSGGEVTLEQSQSYVKRSPNATLQLELSQAFLQARDHNGRPLSIECPNINIGNKSDEDLVSVCHPLSTKIEFRAAAYRGVRSPTRRGLDFFTTHGLAELYGFDGKWKFFATPMGDADTPLWTNASFTVTDDISVANPKGLDGRDPLVELKPLVLNIDLSSIDVCPRSKKADECLDQAFTVMTILKAEAWNWRGRESGAAAFLRDPLNIGNQALRVTGLEATNNPQPLPTEQPEPIACSTGPDPAAGVLQFSAGSYSAMEGTGARGGARDILVTRAQGSKGAVSVNFSAGGGSAVAGVDYDAPAITVRFSDGDSTPRLVPFNVLLSNTVAEPDKTANLTLTNPGGCASLGAQSSALLTILDDDRLPPPPPPSGGLDPTFGNAGKATSTESNGNPLSAFGGDRSAMALQADGKIVMVGGTFTDFILARFNADGSLDQGFGVGGKITTDMGGGNRLEEATAVAIQPDGKIVVVGYTAIPTTPPAPALPPTFALARYNSNGSLDTSFGSGGRVSGNVNGNAYAVAIQSDGKIVVAGEVSFPSTNGLNFSDFVVARFNANGNLDTSFGADVTGQVVTDIGLATNSARNLVLQPNGAIVVSGKPQGNTAGFDHTDMVRYLPNGLLDPSFGSGGKLTLTGSLVGEGLALQSDGKFVLAGSVTVGTFPASSTRFALTRLRADGSADTSFGSAGTVSTAFTINAAAAGVALQRDGKIVAVGTTVLAVNPNFVVARYNVDGSIDTGFGSDGNLSIDFFGFTDIGESVLVQPDGKIVVGGQARNNFDGYGLARINP